MWLALVLVHVLFGCRKLRLCALAIRTEIGLKMLVKADFLHLLFWNVLQLKSLHLVATSITLVILNVVDLLSLLFGEHDCPIIEIHPKAHV